MKTISHKLVAAVVGASAMIAASSPAAERSRYWGAGQATCGRWTDASKDPQSITRAIMESWLFGYVQRMSIGNPELVKGQDPESLRAFVDNYCRAHPLETVMSAAMSLDIALMDRQSPPK
jgi:hypothetical protein